MIDRFVLILGAMKAGTTALFEGLRRHPGIAASCPKEPEFWVDEAQRKRGFEAYCNLWDWDPKRHLWALEASTSYAKVPVRPTAAFSLRDQPAEFRFVYVVRDPIARIRSQYEHSLPEGWIEKPIHEELASEAVWFSNYRIQLEPYAQVFGKRSILVLSHEELVRDPAAALRRTFAHLDLEPVAAEVPLPRSNSSSHYRGLRLLQLVAQRIPTPPELEAEISQNLAFESVVELSRQLAAEQGRPGLVDELLEEMQRAVTPSEAQAAQIHELLHDDLLRFRDDWGVDPWSGERVSESPRGIVSVGTGSLATASNARQ